MKRIRIVLAAILTTAHPAWAANDTGRIVSVGAGSVSFGKDHAHSFRADGGSRREFLGGEFAIEH